MNEKKWGKKEGRKERRTAKWKDGKTEVLKKEK